MHILVVAGARPNFMKVAPVLRALTRTSHEFTLVHTGQHYDWNMSGSFFEDLGIPEPHHFLEVGSGSHAVQTARIMERFEPILLETRADWLLVPGDVNSTLACALVAAKLKEECGTRLAHLEAGLRSHDWRMPEEINRVLTDRLSDLLLTPSEDAHANLEAEGIDRSRVAFVGNIMIDTLFAHLQHARLPVQKIPAAASSEYALATLHRPSNVDSPGQLAVCLDAFGKLARSMPVIFPAHPRTVSNIGKFGLKRPDGVHIIDPLPYTEMLALTNQAAVVLTDSGGLQEETTALGVPCVTLREQTERPVTVTLGTNRLAPWPLTAKGIFDTVEGALRSGRVEPGEKKIAGWDGHAADRVVAAMTGAMNG